MNEEREIDLIDLVSEVLRHWRGLFICFVIGLSMFSVYSYGKNYIYETRQLGQEGINKSNELKLDYTKEKAVEIALDYERLYAEAKENNDLEKVATLGKAVVDAMKNFDDNQIKYFEERAVLGLWKTSAISVDEKPGPAKVNLKTVIIGTITLCFLYVVYWIAKYVVDGRLKSSDDLTRLVDIPCIGRIYSHPEPFFFVDKYINRLKYFRQGWKNLDESVELTAAVIFTIVSQKNIPNVSIIGCNTRGESFSEAMECCDKLASVLKLKYQIKVDIIGDIVFDKNDVENLKTTKNAFLVGKAGVTRYTDLKSEIQLINQLDISTWGVIIIE